MKQDRYFYAEGSSFQFIDWRGGNLRRLFSPKVLKSEKCKILNEGRGDATADF